MEYQDILSTIKANSDKEVARIKEAAEKECAEAKQSADDKVKAIKEKARLDAKVARAETLARRMTVADLDVKKMMLSAKQAVIDQVYETAKAKLKSLKTADYKKLVEGMIDMVAEDGDEVVAGVRDQKVITTAFVKKIADKKGITLTLSYDEKIDGGIIVKGADCDKNMTLDLEVASVKVATETEISKRLF